MDSAARCAPARARPGGLPGADRATGTTGVRCKGRADIAAQDDKARRARKIKSHQGFRAAGADRRAARRGEE